MPSWLALGLVSFAFYIQYSQTRLKQTWDRPVLFVIALIRYITVKIYGLYGPKITASYSSEFVIVITEFDCSLYV